MVLNPRSGQYIYCGGISQFEDWKHSHKLAEPGEFREAIKALNRFSQRLGFEVQLVLIKFKLVLWLFRSLFDTFGWFIRS